MKMVAMRATRSRKISHQTARCPASGLAIESHGTRLVPAFVKRARSSLSILILLSASGCANWPDDKYKPQVPQAAKLPFVDQAFATMMAERKGKYGAKAYPRPVRLNDYKDSLRELLVTVMRSAETSNDQFWDVSMTTLIGGVAGTIGALSGQVGLTNTGLAVAGAGQIQKTYYNPEHVRNHHLNAHTKLACISTEISTLSTIQRQLAMRSNAEGASEAAFALDYIAHSVDAVLVNYRKVLLGMAPQVSTREDILRFAVEYQAQTAKAKAVTAAAGGPAPDIEGELDNDDPSASTPPAEAQSSSVPAVSTNATDMPASSATVVTP